MNKKDLVHELFDLSMKRNLVGCSLWFGARDIEGKTKELNISDTAYIENIHTTRFDKGSDFGDVSILGDNGDIHLTMNGRINYRPKYRDDINRSFYAKNIEWYRLLCSNKF